jgi:hypothetical protein
LGELFGFARAQAAQPQSAATNLPPQLPHPASAAAPDPRSQTCRDCRATIGAVASILTGEALAWCTLLARLVMTPPRGSQQAPGPLSPRHCLLQEGRLPHAPPTCHNAHSSALTQRTPECAKTRIFACAKTRTVIALRGFSGPSPQASQGVSGTMNHVRDILGAPPTLRDFARPCSSVH